MELNKTSETTPDEPEDGWRGGPQLYVSEILTISLCRYTGEPILSLDLPCPRAEQHPPGLCAALYHSAAALQRGEIEVMQYPLDVPVREVRAGGPGDDPVATTYE